jgi:cellulose synthase/poly-beta-1,6-N-acetylglucosamine synthase-like glycosyltransferase
LTELLSIVTLALSGLYALVMLYLIVGWARLKRPSFRHIEFKTKVTILIAARDEEAGIALTINDLLAQDYPKHLTEIIIVDDHSTDRTAEIISSYASQGVKLLQLKEDKPLNSYKKKAISMAIDISTGEFMVATDADCRMGPKWLSSIVHYYESNDLVMISSPVSYFEERSFFERLQTLEFSYLVAVGGAYIGNNYASTCNGANFAYRKDVFYEVGGFKGIDDIASGDDELLLQKVAQKYQKRIGFLKMRQAIVYTHAKHTVKEFLSQRQRWASKSTKYKDKRIVAFAVGIWCFNVLSLINAGLSFFGVAFFKLFLLQFIIKIIFEIAFLLPVNIFFRRPWLVSLLIVLSPVHILYMFYVGIVGNTRKYVWKGRTVR